MLRNFIAISIVMSSIPAFAEEFSVIDVRRNITLADNDPVYKDFYINAGEGSGLKKNLVVTAVRKLTIRDASGAQAFGEIMVPVGQLKVIAVFGKIAVAREFTLLSRDELPMLEQTGIMTGDRIDLQGAFIDTSKPKRKTAEAAPAAAIAVAALTAPVVIAPTAIAASADVPTASPANPAPVAGPVAPASGASVTPPAATAPHTPASIQTAAATTPQKLEKTADSGHNTEL